jgi:hypothetical protein
MLADKCSSADFLPQLAGLLQQAAVRPEDRLVGLGDGADWVEDALDTLTDLSITDVYHAVTYLDILMQALNYSEASRAFHRKQWFTGKVNARDWLQDHLPDPEVWLTWSDEAQSACRYLENRLDRMAYRDFSAQGFPIGSGQVEAMNKSVIGKRMKQSGMHWSEPGAKAMASFRAQLCAKHTLIDFDDLRFNAFTLPAPSP